LLDDDGSFACLPQKARLSVCRAHKVACDVIIDLVNVFVLCSHELEYRYKVHMLRERERALIVCSLLFMLCICMYMVLKNGMRLTSHYVSWLCVCVCVCDSRLGVGCQVCAH
jgi:hypothetical protein